VGTLALNANTTGGNNVVMGYEAMRTATAVEFSVAIGSGALRNYNNGFPTTGRNTAVGYQSMIGTTTGSYNTALGYQSLDANTTGNLNTAVGYAAMPSSTTGGNNTAMGYASLQNNTTGNNNTAYGYQAGFGTSTGGNNTAVGYQASVNNGTLNNTTALGFQATNTANNQVRIGNNGVTSIGGFVAWTNLSDGRFKKNIEKNVPGLDFILKLEPVTYNFDFLALDKATKINAPTSAEANTELQNAANPNAQTRFSGFIAQDVEKAAQSIGYEFSGIDKAKNETDVYGLRYSEFVVPMVKAIQEQQAQIELLKKQNEELLRIVNELQNKK
jgi:hypothetical protein